jgi:hypothetical protein
LLYRWVSKYREKIPDTILKRIFTIIKLFPKNFINILKAVVDNSNDFFNDKTNYGKQATKKIINIKKKLKKQFL